MSIASDDQPVAIGNSFPLGLIQRPVSIMPKNQSQLHYAVAEGFVSFWGHMNTLALVEQTFGVDLTPSTARPVLTLSEAGFPALDGYVFDAVWVLAPQYQPGYRPVIGEEVPSTAVVDWQILLMSWAVDRNCSESRC